MTQEIIPSQAEISPSQSGLPVITESASLDELFDYIVINIFQNADIENLPLNLNLSREELLTKINESINNCTDEEKLINGLRTCNIKHFFIKKAKAFLDLPSEIIMGLILKNLKKQSNKNFEKLAQEKFPDISFRTCENYMFTSQIIKYPSLFKYLTAGTMTIRRIITILTSPDYDSLFKGKEDFIAHAFSVISENEELTDIDYARMAQYVSLYHTKFKHLAIKDSLYYELYKTGFEFKSRDADFICSRAIVKNKLVKPNLLNTYISKLLTYELNRDKARDFIENKSIYSKSNVEDMEIRYKDFNNGIEDLQSSIDYLTNNNNNFIISNERKESVSKLIETLTTLYKKSFPNG